jgi:hypothetical protein
MVWLNTTWVFDSVVAVGLMHGPRLSSQSVGALHKLLILLAAPAVHLLELHWVAAVQAVLILLASPAVHLLVLQFELSEQVSPIVLPALVHVFAWQAVAVVQTVPIKLAAPTVHRLCSQSLTLLQDEPFL